MFCENCGKQMADNSTFCPSCGNQVGQPTTAQARIRPPATQSSAFNNESQSSIARGFFILLVSWFTMPLKTLRLTAQLLREVGRKGALDISSDLPHLTWMRVAGSTVASAGIFVILIGGVLGAFASLGQMRDSATSALGGFIGIPILAILLAVAWDWFIMWLVEFNGLWTGIANDIKTVADRDK